jgi:glutamine amidotransferase
MSIAIIDYGMGNLRSVEKALEYLDFKDICITSKPEEILNADKVILPGVGAFRDAIETIRQKGIDEVIYKIVEQNKPFLGICLGMQLLFDKSYENGEYNGLGVLEGEIVRLPDTQIIPQIGWNSLDIAKKEPLFDGLPEKPYVYFVHSYYLETNADIVSATTFYGKDIQVAVQKGNVFATQFHPEKSGDIGLQILKNFGGKL